MLDIALLHDVATQMMNSTRVKLQGKILRVGRTSVQHLKNVTSR